MKSLLIAVALFSVGLAALSGWVLYISDSIGAIVLHAILLVANLINSAMAGRWLGRMYSNGQGKPPP